MRVRTTVLVLGGLAAGAFVVYTRSADAPAEPAAGLSRPGPGQRGGAGGRPGPGGAGAFARPPMTVELAAVRREPLAEHVTIVGTLIGAATVEAVPKVSGRLESVLVRLGDRVGRGQTIAKVEDREIREQVKQAEASFEVARATIRQREADLKFAETNLERSRNLFERQLLPRQSMDDADARQQAASAQLDLARAQFAQASSRLDELRITLANTAILSPVEGFVAKRYLDPGAFVSSNAPVASVVDIRSVRLVANLVEKDMRRVVAGTPAEAQVDAFPGEQFNGRVARVAPVLDPATRTAEMEIEILNPTFRLKPGMYARVRLTVDVRENALVVPRNAVIDLEGRRGVFVAEGGKARFLAVETGIQDQDKIEIARGLDEGTRVVTTGAGALREGDDVLLAGQRPGGDQPAGPGARSGRPGGPPGGRSGRPPSGNPPSSTR